MGQWTRFPFLSINSIPNGANPAVIYQNNANVTPYRGPFLPMATANYV